MKYMLVGLIISGSAFLHGMRPLQEFMEHIRDPRERYIKIILHRTDRRVSPKGLSKIASLVIKMTGPHCYDLMVKELIRTRNDVFMMPDSRIASRDSRITSNIASLPIEMFVPRDRIQPALGRSGIVRDLPYMHVKESVNVLIGNRGDAEGNYRR